MKAVGIIAEYNPFHNGHAYHIAEAKRLSGADTCAVCMSASFVQRGEPACLDKFTRSRLAVLNGADIVFELPDLFSCACAEWFAYGGVKILASSGIVSSIAFGSESGDIERLKAAAGAELAGDALKDVISEGHSYPKAVALYLEQLGLGGALGPNDTLAVEYVRAINRIGACIEPIAVLRSGSGHDSMDAACGFLSAGAVRKLMQSGDADGVHAFVPEAVFAELQRAAASPHGIPAQLSGLDQAILYRLRTLGAQYIARLADVSEGLENPIYAAANAASSAEELLTAVKTKRYTLSRLRRILMNALLGTSAELSQRAVSDENALYIRVLAVRASRANELLKLLAANASLPVITSAKDSKALSGTAKEVFDHACGALKVHSLAFPRSHAVFPAFSDIIVPDP